ncbi:salicylate hydroxylase [Rhodococcus rhodochrous J45]|uniref:Salicylate hydroxylase n=1 Tax=Rhodococcus rhodochrous J45 TaxID=935266 RepID=A0A562E270_RHORH|nr:FAD-dependent monooxygenase [Rhodococcus rhodochrous]TWH16105.1 salicylate hydroxylase [Rhodococcus rhodochrous J45]
MSNHIHSVVIAGGGLGGLTAAYLLRNVGMKVTVLEAAKELGEVGAGIQTAPNASRILINAGLLPQLAKIKTVPTDQVRRRWSDGKILASRPLGDSLWQEFGAPYWHFHRADLHGMLVDVCSDPALPGPVVDLHVASKVVSADRSDPARPAAITEDGRRYEGDVLIGADGVRSRVRASLGMSEDDLLFSGQMVYRAMVPGEKLKADPETRFLWDQFHSTMWYGPGKHLVHYFIREGEYLNVAAACASDVDLDEGWTEETTAQDFIDAFDGWDSRLTSILEKAEGPILKWALFAHRQNPVWVQGHVGLLGDAAHAMVPFQAQGASQAIEDAAILAEELAVVDKAGIATALLRYGAKRAKRAGMVQEASAQNAHLYQLPDGPEQQLRDEKLAKFEGESDISYEWLWSGKHEPMTPGYSFSKGDRPALARWQDE